MSKNFDRKSHWEKVYQTKQFAEVSWYQARPDIALDFLQKFDLPKTAKIIDIGGGESKLVDFLLEEGYTNITVLDISEQAIERVKSRLGEAAAKVKWIIADAAQFEPTEQYDFWHDRAAFHFLTEEADIRHYVQNVQQNVRPGGFMVLGTFSTTGPDQCSGLHIRKYSEASMAARLQGIFEKLKCLTIDHVTPSNNVQNFIFCSFKKLATA